LADTALWLEDSDAFVTTGSNVIRVMKGLGNFRFLILGAGRGGTSLLAGLLDAHRRLEVGFEQFAIPILMGQQFRHRRHQMEERTTAFLRACQEEAARFPGKIWGDKITTEQLHALADPDPQHPEDSVSKEQLLDYFFNGPARDLKIVFILRDGRTCVRSKVSRTGQDVALACQRWLFSVQVYQFLSGRPSCHCLKFENLLQHPAAELQGICEFLEIPYEASMLQGTANSKMRPEYQLSTIDAAKLTLQGVPEGLECLDEALRECGYPE